MCTEFTSLKFWNYAQHKYVLCEDNTTETHPRPRAEFWYNIPVRGSIVNYFGQMIKQRYYDLII